MTPAKNWRVILALVISILGILFFILQALALGSFWLLSIFDPVKNIAESLPFGLFFWTSMFGALLLCPLLLISINDLRGKASIGWLDLHQPFLAKASAWVILLWPLVVLLGWLVVRVESVAAYLLGPINLLVAGIPILWVYAFAQRGLAGGSQIRKWWIFGFSIAFLPLLIISIELIAALFLGGMGIVGLSLHFSANPQFEQQALQLIKQIARLEQDLPALKDLLKDFLLQPSIIYWGLASFGALFPIIEEIIKPAALWTLADRKISSQEGFVGGLLCGAGFALMENVLFFTNVFLAEEWLLIAIGRAGTGVLHMLASGLIGWGLARAWRDGEWYFLGLTTLGAFFLHGIWNILAVVSGITPLLILSTEPTLGQALLFHSPLVLLLVLSVIALIMLNRHLRKEKPTMAGYVEHNRL